MVMILHLKSANFKLYNVLRVINNVIVIYLIKSPYHVIQGLLFSLVNCSSTIQIGLKIQIAVYNKSVTKCTA